MAVEISEVTLRAGDDLITAARLDYPQTGPVDGYAFEVYGWVVSKAPIAEVEFVHDGSVVACCGLTVSRPDVAEMYDSSSSQVGFWTAIGTVGLQAAFAVGVRVVFGDGRRAMIAEIRGTQQLTSAFTPSMQPIIVTHPGRSGSTRLMRMLAEHPDIVVHERFPYETYAFAYWMHFIQVLAAPATTSHGSWQFSNDLKRLPPFPYFFNHPHVGLITPDQATLDRWYATDQVEELARVAQDAVESFYREYASSRKRTTPAFFAEKIIPTGRYRWIRRQLYPHGREIFLFREPRDHLASVLAFFPEDRRQVETDEQYVDLIRTRLLSLVETWKSTPQYSTLVRYEDLVCSPTEQIRAMLDALELDSSAKIVRSMVKAGNETTVEMDSHRTSRDARSSIGRWKQDLEPRLQKICDAAFDGLLDELGYSSS